MMRLDSAETAARLPYAKLVGAIGRAARELATGVINSPERLIVEIGTAGTLLCMPAVSADLGITKIITVHPQNPSQNLPAIQGEVIVFDVSTGQRLLMLDGPTVTARRTAAVTLLAIDKLARARPRSALLIGTGVQATAHIEALLQYFGVGTFWVASRTLQSAVLFCEKMQAMHAGISIKPLALSNVEPVAMEADLVVALTTSRAPVIPSQLPDATLAIGVGAFRPDMAEIPPELLRQRRVVVDNLNGAKHEAGDLLQAKVVWSEVLELSQLLEREPKTASLPSAFKSVGHASWDLAAARVALQD
jgi:1-piperideine-2-carboxylate/1-pyrroline-2-carboxylate reductase [NAD(P)H]